MEPFYELSDLTQRRFGGRGGEGGQSERVKVIEVKTVGAYEVAILSAKDAGSLDQWLKSHRYSVPEGGAALVDEYVAKGWYFVAAKIQLSGGVSFKLSPGSRLESDRPQTREREELQQKMSSGELHPLLISFDTPRCIFPLKISAVGGKPSEVSLYVLSRETLLNRDIFEKRLAKLRQARVEYNSKATQKQTSARTAMQNSRRLQMAYLMYTVTPPPEKGVRAARDWSLEDLDAIAAEGEQPAPLSDSDEPYYPGSSELSQMMQASAEKISQSAKVMNQLSGIDWRLTKQVYTFRSEDMKDLEFEPAIPVLAAVLPAPEGRTVAALLYHCGPAAVPVLLAACTSTNSSERMNASAVLQSFKDRRLAEPLLVLLRDPVPDVRLNAVMATAGNWDVRFNDALFNLLRDPHPRVRRQAAQWLTFHEPKEQTRRYMELLRDPDPEVIERALQVLMKINPSAMTRAELLRLLSVPRLDVVSQSLNLLEGTRSGLPVRPPTVGPGTIGGDFREKELTSLEALPLTTNRLTLARLAGLKILHRNGDADAIALALPLLQDTNSIVRNRAYGLLRAKTGQSFPQESPANWENWWQQNKAGFVPR